MDGHPHRYEEPQDLRTLVEAAGRMADGEFRELVTVQAKGEIGRLASFINQTMRNLQELDPSVGVSSRRLPKMIGHLSEVVQETEQASLRVLDEIDRIAEEQAAMGRDLQQLAVLLNEEWGKDDRRNAALQTVARLREIHGRVQGRALEIMGAMEFQDITAQSIQKSMALITEIHDRLLRLLVLFNIPPDEKDGVDVDDKWKAINEFATASASNAMNQEMADRVLAEFGRNGR
ncbi:MAG TPA: protein phosphatase CheZ [Verrucomicrobiae bacterium]|nr:protein phosphatase CheZ [Verrucomicrobiae bacterium]